MKYAVGFQRALKFILGLRLGRHAYTQDVKQVLLEEVERRRRMHPVLNRQHEIELNLFYRFHTDLFVRNFFVDRAHLDGEDVLELGRDEHRGHSDAVQIVYLQDAAAPLEVPVHERHGEEERLIVALEVCEHLNHPVDHTCAHLSIDTVFEWLRLVTAEALAGVEFFVALSATQVPHDVVSEVSPYVDVLSIDIARVLPRHMQRRMNGEVDSAHAGRRALLFGRQRFLRLGIELSVGLMRPAVARISC